MNQENIYKIDDVLISTGKVLLGLVLLFCLGGACFQFAYYSKKDIYIIEATSERDEKKETISTRNMHLYVRKDPVTFFQRHFPAVKKVDVQKKGNGSSKRISYILFFQGKKEKQVIRNLKPYFKESERVAYLKDKYGEDVRFRKMDAKTRKDAMLSGVWGALFLLVFIGSLPVCLLYFGYKVRKKEKRIVVIWKALTSTVETSLRDIEMSMGFSRKFVMEALAVINSRGLGFFVYDKNTGMVVDSRLRTEFIVVEKCPNCAGELNMRVSISGKEAPKCPFCHTSFSPEFLNQLKWQTMQNIRRQEVEKQQNSFVPQRKQKEFRMGKFIFLLFICWPIAIYYAVSRNQ
ncbi:MAG: hypothetical protein AAF518_07485 [Spirochaetota bacterium]